MLQDNPIKSILADLNYLYEDNIMDIDGTVLLRLDGNAKGVLRAVKLQLQKKIILQLRSMEQKDT